MTAKSNSEAILIEDFSASAQISLFQKLKQEHFSGQLCIRELNQRRKWVFFLYVGRIIYTTGGAHSVRRWRRNLASYLPQIASRLQQELETINPNIFKQAIITWEYKLLNLWVEQQKIHREQANQVISSTITEILFDISQAGKITYHLKAQENLDSQQLVLIDSEQQIIKAWKLWQTWKDANFAEISPNLAPVIIKPEELQNHTSEKTYQALKRLLTGTHSLRDLAIQKKTNPLTITRLIMPHLRLKSLKLIEIKDIPLPFALTNKSYNSSIPDLSSLSSSSKTKSSTSESLPNSATSTSKLVGYVDHNPLMSKIMAQVIKGSGYDLISETDPINVIALFLDRNPDIIFIDIELSGINGYEVCSQLRQIDCFRETPIILFSKSINPLDRVKAKIAGCTEILSKSKETKSILDILNKYFS